MADVESIIGGWTSGFFDTLGPIIFVVIALTVVAVIVYLIFMLGIFEKRPFTAYLRRPRSGGNYKTSPYPFRFLTGRNAGYIDVKYGLLSYSKLAAPPEKFIREGEAWGFNPTRDECQWHEPPQYTDEQKDPILTIPSQLSEGQQLAWGRTYGAAYVRTHKPNPLEKHALAISLIIAALIICAGMYFGQEQVAHAETIYADAVKAQTETLNTMIKNSTIVIYKTDTGSIPGSVVNPNQIVNQKQVAPG